jgi:indole-3-glycerol phosphate synthase
MNKLKEILDHKRNEVAEAKNRKPLAELAEELDHSEPTRDFVRTIRSDMHEDMACIAEIKKASPSKGVITQKFNPDRIAREYFHGGARAISVLTDEKYFQGHHSYIKIVKASVPLPVLRKDFIIDEYQLYESRIIGADAVLLIVNALKESELKRFLAIAKDLDLGALVECHTKKEIDRAVECEAEVIGINNRDLETLEVSLDTSIMLKRFLPNTIASVSESGIRNAHHIRLLREAGFDAVLIGEHLMAQEDRAHALQELLHAPVVP